MLQIRDLPLEQCLAVRSSTSLARVAELAAEIGSRYILVRTLTGEIKGVQLTTVASWMASRSPSVTVEAMPVVGSVVEVELTNTIVEALSLIAYSTASVLLVKEFENCLVLQRNVLQMTAGLEANGAYRPELRS
jgi:hypothetical protein